ncbi:hypothetical protein [Kitasatospora cheerisanensis]|uniref:Uncharacterized protein n=1 Tax=Kitasatospora cheerisanensis KCTC 2395 TaxID=1348663 RepID=A0A066YTI3_9ACTN|nr:hypothetical protein [Kitasatospora cheerisanensis]KDN81205.1 hypothetical protein KCH_70160 [Kitasatospora cheerisanensis KCTC 2395]
MEEPKAAGGGRTSDPRERTSLMAALAEAVRDRDERSLRRLLARFAVQVTFADLHALRDALDPRHHRGRHPDPP